MPEDKERPRLREHLHEMREALGGIGKDVELEVSDAPRNVREGTKNVLARAAGVRRTPVHEWRAPSDADGSGNSSG